MTVYSGPGEVGVRRVVAEASRLPAYDPDDERWESAWLAARAAWTPRAAWAATWDAAWAAAWDEVWAAAWDAVWAAARRVARDEVWAAARDAGRAARAEVFADLLTPDQYQTLTAPWQVWVDTFGLAEEGA